MLSSSGSIDLLRIWHGKQEQHRGIESIIEVNNWSNFSLCRASLAGRSPQDMANFAGVIGVKGGFQCVSEAR